MSADGKPDGTDLFKSEGFWRIAGTAVFLRHVLLLQPEGPFEFKVEDLCFWLAQLLRSAENEIAEELDAHQVLLSSQPADDVAEGVQASYSLRWRSGQSLTAEEVQTVLQHICSPLNTLRITWLTSLKEVILDASMVLEELMKDYLDVSALRKVQVQYAAMFNEEWSTPYEVCWQANGADNSIIMPDVPNFTERHFQHFQRSAGHTSTGETLLYEALALYLIPCHELLHIVQHLHGHLLDSDSHSYAMEHDASRLNYLLLWHVLERRSPEPQWSKWVLMLEGINRSLSAFQRIKAQDAAYYAAYRQWADTFGLDAPSKIFASSGDEMSLSLEGMVKMIVAGEALVANYESQGPHLEPLLRVAFDPARQGDVYSCELPDWN
ncbi:unnamed protein product [Cladocopium goreaui]|uniref:Uncharacterized protein n=1 Tax=Cladocopium goreaui TaxID=2562237 RepID=A0A9P1GRD6_9DINO|nr:unnamed protein product [Cladocopium goreaui]